MLDRFFGLKNRRREVQPDVFFGRYSDNNKTVEKTKQWNLAEELFKKKKYLESIESFFIYLRDEKVNNTLFTKTTEGFTFNIFQGSKIIKGYGEKDHLHVRVRMAQMSQASVPVMRRLLECNYQLYYSRFSLNNEDLVMQFDGEIATANPNKLYYALKELCTTADKQDDLLIHDFALLESIDSDHILPIPESEKEVKYKFLIQWTDECIQLVKELDIEKFTGGISFLILALIFRIDYLITPEGNVMHELEKIQAVYFKKDNLSAIEKNRIMLTALEKFRSHSKEEFMQGLIRTVSTFSIRQPKNQHVISDSIAAANKNINWYNDNQQPIIAKQISEYAISFCQYSYSLPKLISEFFQVFMQVNYPDYFKMLGFTETLFSPEANRFKIEEIEHKIREIEKQWKSKYLRLSFHVSKLKYDSLLNFNMSFTNSLADLDLET